MKVNRFEIGKWEEEFIFISDDTISVLESREFFLERERSYFCLSTSFVLIFCLKKLKI